MSYLPDSCHSPLPIIDLGDKTDRVSPELDHIIPDETSRGYDMTEIIKAIADGGEFLEPHRSWAHNIIVAFIRIMGQPVGVIANNPKYYAES